MVRRPKEVLINPSWEEMVGREPLLAFSFYLSGRVNVLLDLSDEITELLDCGFTSNPVDGRQVERAGTLMWLWTLGAYEVVRTLCQASSCFSSSAKEKLKRLKKNLSTIRMPAAKMEKAGQKVPVTSDRSSDGWDIQNKDLLIGDPEASPHISARDLLNEFADVFSLLRADDVLGRHEDSYVFERKTE